MVLHALLPDWRPLMKPGPPAGSGPSHRQMSTGWEVAPAHESCAAKHSCGLQGWAAPGFSCLACLPQVQQRQARLLCLTGHTHMH